MFKKWFKKNNMENKDGVQNEDILQEDLNDTAKPNPNAVQMPTMAELLDEIGKVQDQADALKDKYLRQAAEFENFKRRTVREKIDTIQMASRDTMAALIPVLDDFDRASKNEQFTEGVNLVYQKLLNAVTSKGLKAVETNPGDDFDPEFHEAITQIPAGEALFGKVVVTIEKGYTLNEKLIRHAKVVVGN